MADDAAPDKAAPATFSSFINKNSGKKFAPKAARRRPAVGGSGGSGSAGNSGNAGSAGSAANAVGGAQAAEKSAGQAEKITEEPHAVTAPLPTPAPTQEPVTAIQEPVTSASQEPTISAIQEPPPPAIQPIHTPAPTQPTQEPTDPPEPTPQHAPVTSHAPTHVDTAPTDEGRSPKRRRIESPSAPTVPVAVMLPAQPQTDETPADSTAKRAHRSLPWTAVNHPPADDAEPEPPKKRAPKPRKKAAEPELDEHGEPVQPPPKKPRKPRKDKGKETAEGDTADPPKPKPKRVRKKSTPATDDPSADTEPKRRGRPPREDTPSDAEDHIIDPDAICMDDLASRNIRVGKLSRREKEMRKIDWDAVRQRRREEDARHITTKEAQAAVDALLESSTPEATTTGPRYHVVDGRIELVHDSATIDRERDADAQINLMTITEEDDLTTRITSRSFMKNNKRFPNDFVLPGQGKRWTAESTATFYQGLRSFGTDFQMIAHMFPGMTRRSIKTKFTREERDNPDIIRDCLRGASTMVEHWDTFLEKSMRDDDSFADVDRIKRELKEEEEQMKTKIEEAKREKEERDEQRRIAGVVDDENQTGDKERDKGRKKRKDKNVTFAEEGVEILGAVDDDPNWGM